MGKSVVVVGSYVQDLLFYTPKAPLPGQTVIGDFKSGPGGKGSNQAVACKRAGMPVSFIGGVGDDLFAQAAQKFHHEEGIDSHLVMYPHEQTGAASIVVDENGENEIVVALGANDRLQLSEKHLSIIRSASIVVSQLECNLDATRLALKTAKEAGAYTVINLAPMRDDFDPEILQFVDVIIPNETEFVELLHLLIPEKCADFRPEDLETISDEELLGLFASIPVECIILTLGAAGVIGGKDGKLYRFEALKNVNVVDTTGAGDAFVGGMVAGYELYDQDIAKAIEYGIVVAGLAVTKNGTSPAMPNRSEIVAKIKAEGIGLDV